MALFGGEAGVRRRVVDATVLECFLVVAALGLAVVEALTGVSVLVFAALLF